MAKRYLFGAALFAAAAAALLQVPAVQAADSCVRILGPEWGSEKMTPDPAVQQTTADINHARAIYEPLVDLDTGFLPVPVLAESWESDPAGTEWLFHLRQGVTFHDGSAFDSGDVVYTLTRLLDPATASAGASELSVLTPEGIEAVDAHTVKVTTASPVVEMPTVLASKFALIVPEGASTEDITRRPNGTGPFKMDSFAPGQARSILQANEAYWREGVPKAPCLEISGITEPVARSAAIMSDAADLAILLDGTMIDALKDRDDVTLTQATGGTVMTLSMWVDTPPFDDLRVRQALKLVVDREEMVRTALNGYGVAGNDNPIPPNFPDAYRSDVIARDVEKAKALLAEAGYPDGLTVELFTGDTFPGIMLMSQAYQQMAADAGITVDLVVQPAADFWDAVWLKRPFVTSFWGLRPPSTGLAVAYRSDAEWNETHWYRDDYDALLDEAAVTVDPDERRRLYQEAQRLLAEEGGVIVPMFPVSVAALREGCSGFVAHPDNARPDFSTVACQ